MLWEVVAATGVRPKGRGQTPAVPLPGLQDSKPELNLRPGYLSQLPAPQITTFMTHSIASHLVFLI